MARRRSPPIAREILLEDVGEDGLLDLLTGWIDPPPRGVLGMGDDAAVIPGEHGPHLLTTDVLVEGTHFRRNWFTPEEAGEKAIGVNVSDAAAMAGRPTAALVSLIAPPRLPVAAVRRLYRGLRRAARREGVAILGGNLARGDAVSISVFLLGRAPRAVTRDGARPGDHVYVTGAPGLAALGLRLVQRHARGGPDLWTASRSAPAWRRALGAEAPAARSAAQRFLTPLPRMGQVPALRRLSPTALIDVSDGLGKDLLRLARASGVRIEADAAALPAGSGFRRLADRLGVDPAAAAWQGGEDYELAFTLSPRRAARVGARGRLAGLPITRIGRVVAGDPAAILRNGPRALARGFEHFASAGRE